MSGTLTGILLARTVSGALTSIAGWRSPFVVAAAALLLLPLALHHALPDVEPATQLPYRHLLRSVGELIRAEAVLRRRMLYGACGFAGFTLAWTTISFVLASSPYRFSPQTIGLFGLVGVVGTVGVQRLGRLADRGQGQRATGVALGVLISSWGVLALARASLAAVVIGLILIDAGVQGQNVLSQHAIYGLGPENASRVTTAWVTANYAGGAIGSATGALAWDHGGWPVVCLVGVAIAAVAGVSWLTDRSTSAGPPLRASRQRRNPGAPT